MYILDDDEGDENDEDNDVTDDEEHGDEPLKANECDIVNIRYSKILNNSSYYYFKTCCNIRFYEVKHIIFFKIVLYLAGHWAIFN